MDIKEDTDAYDDGPTDSGLQREGRPGEGSSGRGLREGGPSGSGGREESPGGKEEAGEQEEGEEEEEVVNDQIVDPSPGVSKTGVGSKEQEAAPEGTEQVAKDGHKGGTKNNVKTTPPPTVIPGTLGLHIPPDSPEKKRENKEPLTCHKDTPKSAPVSPNLCPSQKLDPEVPVKTADNPAGGPEARSSSTHGIHPPAVQSKLALLRCSIKLLRP